MCHGLPPPAGGSKCLSPSASSVLPRTGSADSPPTRSPRRPAPRGSQGTAPSVSHAPPARARSLTHSWDPQRGARTQPGPRHLRALPPAGLAAAAAPARSPLYGPAPRRPAPSPPLRPAPRLLHWGLPLSPRALWALQQLNPSPAAPERVAAGGGLRHWWRGDLVRQPSPTATPPGSAPRLGVARRKPGGAGSGLRWGRGAPPSPPARVPVFETNRSHGVHPARAGRLPAGSNGPGLVEVAGVGLRVLAMAWGRG